VGKSTYRPASQRGALIETLIDNNNFIVLNNGQPTYTHHTGTRSRVDLAIVFHTLGTNSDWEVLSDTLGSDHSPIFARIVHLAEEIDDSLKFILSKADWESFKINS